MERRLLSQLCAAWNGARFTFAVQDYRANILSASLRFTVPLHRMTAASRGDAAPILGVLFDASRWNGSIW
jgi:hypothetical protein